MIINPHNPYWQTALTATLFTFCSRRRSYPHTHTHTPPFSHHHLCVCVWQMLGLEIHKAWNAMCWLCWGLGWLSAPVCIHAEACQRCRFPHRITHSSFCSYSLLHSFSSLSWRVVITYQSLTYQDCTLFISFVLFSAGMMRIFYRLGFIIFILIWLNEFLIKLLCNVTFKFLVDRNEAVLSISRKMLNTSTFCYLIAWWSNKTCSSW